MQLQQGQLATINTEARVKVSSLLRRADDLSLIDRQS